MPWCPVCNTEYEEGRTVCSDCGATLTDTPLPPHAEPVVVLHAQTADEAHVAEATLEAEGIEAYVQRPDAVMPEYGNIEDMDSPQMDVVVPAESAQKAIDILSEPPISEEELAALAEASSPEDPEMV
jgi:hypothetical protein